MLGACDSLAPPTARFQKLNCFNGEAVSFFYKSDKTKDSPRIWMIKFYSIGTQH